MQHIPQLVLQFCHPVHLQIDDPLDAIAVHAFNGTWGVWAVGLFAGKNLVNTSYGFHPYKTDASGASTISRNYGCFMGGNGSLLAAQIVYSIWLGGAHCRLAQPLAMKLSPCATVKVQTLAFTASQSMSCSTCLH